MVFHGVDHVTKSIGHFTHVLQRKVVAGGRQDTIVPGLNLLKSQASRHTRAAEENKLGILDVVGECGHLNNPFTACRAEKLDVRCQRNIP